MKWLAVLFKPLLNVRNNQYTMVRTDPLAQTAVSEIRVRVPLGVMRKVAVFVNVEEPNVSLSMRMIFSSAVEAVSGSSAKDTDEVPVGVNFADVV